jgi:hypothetical protein
MDLAEIRLSSEGGGELPGGVELPPLYFMPEYLGTSAFI